MSHRQKGLLLTAALLLVAMLPGAARAQMDIDRFDSLRQLVMEDTQNRNFKSAISLLNDYIRDTANVQIKGQAEILLGDVYCALRDFYKARDAYASAQQHLAGTPNPGLEKKFDVARREIAAAEIESVRQALDNYYTEHVTYPESLRQLLSLKPELSINDPWGRQYFYAPGALRLLPGQTGQDYELYSQGSGQERVGIKDRAARNEDIRKQLEANAADKTGFSSNYRIKILYAKPDGKYTAVIVSTGYLQETVQVEDGTVLPDDVKVMAVFPEGVVMERRNILGAVAYKKD